MIPGLGITRLLASFVAVFRSRNHSRLDWIPLAWTFCIFIFQLQFWWAIIELPSLVQIWTLGAFLALVGLTLLLFISAAVLLHVGHEVGARADLTKSAAILVALNI